jgi:PemK-like, MazF-like toxin of type II toxin-antitoxin system
MRSLRRTLAGLRPRRRRTITDTPPGGVEYRPRADGRPDPGEVVWAWVPYEEDAGQGKDRPVLLLAERDGRLLGLMLTSQDHDRDAADEARWGRHWMDVGAGAWDRERRPSEVRLDRLLELDPSAVRREGAALPRPVFDAVIQRAREFHRL